MTSVTPSPAETLKQLISVCSKYVIPRLLDRSPDWPIIESVCVSILSLVESPQSLISLSCSTDILLHLSITGTVDFIRLLQQHDLFRLFLTMCDHLDVFERDVRDTVSPAALPSLFQERILLSIYFVMQVPEIQKCSFPVYEHACAACTRPLPIFVSFP
jgi:hypothetical protein